MLMCMCMLNKRVHILVDQELWSKLTKLAKAENMSVGEVIRETVKEKVADKELLERRKKAIASTLKHRKVFKGKIDYEELINAGRER